jgi:hypothetical protein
MSGKEQFVKLPREVLESAAWQSQSINCRRFVDFLMLEYMRRAGRQNGRLKAPRRQLWAVGIGQHFVSGAIAEAEKLGLIDVMRGSRRVASTYALTWLPLHDGAPVSNRWWECSAPAAEIAGARKAAKSRLLSAKQHSKVSAKQHSKDALLSAKQHSKVPETLVAKQHSLYRSSYQDGEEGKEGVVEGEGGGLGAEPAAEGAAAPPTKPAPITSGRACPYRGCGKPTVLAGACAEHARPSAAATFSSGKPNGSAAP